MDKVCPLTNKICFAECAWKLDNMCSVTVLAMSEKIGWNNYIMKEMGVGHHEDDGS